MDTKSTLLLIAATLFSYSSASGSTNERDTVTLPDVMVTAPTKTNPALLPLDVTQIGRTEIENSTESSLLPLMVQKIPGLFVAERGFAGYGISGGSGGTVNIRGVGQGNKVLFMIDGQPHSGQVCLDTPLPMSTLPTVSNVLRSSKVHPHFSMDQTPWEAR